MKALVTDGSYSHTVGIVRYLAKEGVNVSVIGTSKLDIALHSRYCRKALLGPSPMLEEPYIKFLEQVLRDDSYDILIPVGYRAVEVIAKNKNRLESFVNIELPEYECIEIALNKKKTYELAAKLGIPYPETVYPQDFDEVEGLSHKLEYPVVIKGLFEAGKQVVAYPRNRDEFLVTYHKMCDEHHFGVSQLPMVQEYIGRGCNTSLAALYQNGSCKRVFVYEGIRCFPLEGGSSSCARSIYDQEVIEHGTKLLDALNWHGVADVEFKKGGGNNDLKLMEINPKFYATVELALRAGVNFPRDLCGMAIGKELEYSEDYRRGLKYQYPFSKELYHVREQPASIFNVINDFFNPRVKSNIWLSDFKPNFIELMFGLAALLPTRIRALSKRVARFEK